MDMRQKMCKYCGLEKRPISLSKLALLLGIALSAVWFSGHPAVAAEPDTNKAVKIGVVDVERIYAAYDKAKASSEQIEKKRMDLEIELSKKQAELKVLADRYQKGAATMTDKVKQEEQKKIRDLSTEIVTFTRLTNQQLTAENKEQMQLRLNEISVAIQKYAKDNKFDIVVDKKSLPFFAAALNITDSIIAAMKKG
ncbi:MAG: OmpH family outer membrane protein [bacterium]|nr:OmpH family outer membrane protein [bacterium]